VKRPWLWTGVCLVASVPFAWVMLHRQSAQPTTPPIPIVRIATFNASLNRPNDGDLLAELRSGKSEQAAAIAELVQMAGVDILLVCELDRDRAAETATLLAKNFLAVSQRGQPPIDFTYTFVGETNTGEPSGLDLDGDGKTGGPGDAFGYGAFPGQYGMALLSRHPILLDRVRTFRTLPWSRMPEALRPPDLWSDDVWAKVRLSSKTHCDVPIGIGKQVVHMLCSHPTPPAFDGPEDRNGRRNHDEIRFWVDYLTPGRDAWIVDDAGTAGGLPATESFVVLGDLNSDPVDGEARREAIQALLAHPRVQDPQPKSDGAPLAAQKQWGNNATHRGDPAFDTSDFGDAPGTARDSGPGNLRVDYVLPSRDLIVRGGAVFWPVPFQPGASLLDVSDHRLVFVDLEMH